MKAKVYFRLNFISPPLELIDEDEAKLAVGAWCISELNMPPDMVKAISIEKVEVKNESH